ncbi:cryptochrome/DNA photolyase [Chloropicon primus]|uniref:Cryptochrome/DNA photolyase n=1 Tax=Chloropicon primus TaxID=1764295 RepID=A0A5B8MY37_9CHLO|nr:cryptochrome/DNA photolyase [Chloropicon primus]UPR04865.1 cryptochrome/DNA photolyase [Chloropicon primus]|eukprot:QDZ25668.1 cryptochrome/DNA photolyase [Chloropicon primus]
MATERDERAAKRLATESAEPLPQAVGPSSVTQAGKLSRVVVWFRRDLRLEDNPALMAALRAGREVIPLFIWAPEEEGVFTPGLSSRWWLTQSLESLSRKLEALGSRLVLFKTPTTKEGIVPFVKDNDIQAVYFNHLYDPISLVRDKGIRTLLQGLNVHVESFGADLMYEPWEIYDEKGQVFNTFDKFWEHIVNKMPYEPFMPLPCPVAMPKVPDEVKGNRASLDEVAIMTEEEAATSEHLKEKWMPGSDSAHMVWNKFLCEKLAFFKQEKAMVHSDCTSRLSPHMHYGEISVSSLYFVLKKMKLSLSTALDSEQQIASVDKYIKQLGYREFSRYILFHNPFTHERPLLEHLCAVPWQYDQDLFKCWQQGCTGFPLIDAGMQELWSTGWCHNRLRILVGHFFVKYLNLPWQWGLKYFWDTLIDADLECDALGWQYLSGCMIDAPPFSYIMDYEEECKRFDPDGKYVKKWLPLLARVPSKFIHTPWKAPAKILRASGVDMGITYPHRVVNMDQVRKSVKHCCECLEAQKCGPQRGPFRHPTRSDPSRPSSMRTGTADEGMDGPYLPGKTKPEKADSVGLGGVQSHISETDGCHNESTGVVES